MTDHEAHAQPASRLERARALASEVIVRAGELFERAKPAIAQLPYVDEAVAMYFAMRDERTPKWVKLGVAATLLYLVSPFDVIPDFVPVVGQLDDAMLIFSTFKIVRQHVTDEHRERARAWLSETRTS